MVMKQNRQFQKLSIKIFLFISLIILTVFADFWNAYAQSDGALWHVRNTLTLEQFLRFSNIWHTIVFCVAGGILLMFVRLKDWARGLLMVAVFVVFAILPVYSGLRCGMKEPSPLCALVKPFILYSNPNPNLPPLKYTVTLSIIGIFSIAGNKLFCSWVCPIGAVQEVVNLIPLPVKKIKLPFFWTNLLRIVLLVLFFPLFFGFGVILFNYFNPFAPLRWGFGSDFLTVYSWIFLGIVLVLSLFLFRPYCYLACPVGLLSWLGEFITPLRIRVNRERCTRCMKCRDETNCPAIEPIIKEKRVRPDCHSCGRCIALCPEGALSFGLPGKNR